MHAILPAFLARPEDASWRIQWCVMGTYLMVVPDLQLASQMLLCGGKGSGKTGIAATVAARLEQDPQLCICELSNLYSTTNLTENRPSLHRHESILGGSSRGGSRIVQPLNSVSDMVQAYYDRPGQCSPLRWSGD